MALDGFEEFSEAALQDPVERNLRPYRNEYSLYMTAGVAMSALPAGRVLIDKRYGQAYDLVPPESAAIYGATKNMPNADLDDRADMGFLRIPFQKIPRFRVRSLDELKSLIHQLPRRSGRSPLLFRGQNREYLLDRSAATLSALYGDPGAIEPSLLPSAGRLGLDLDAVLPEWAALIQYALIGARSTDDRLRLMMRFGSHYLYRRFATAIAQHYGLPSSGLDASTRLEIALFFALTSCVPQTAPWFRCQPLPADAQPVLYVMEPYPQQVASDFGAETPSWVPATRAHRQNAHFLHRGWGLSQNETARWLLAAFYLDPRGDFGPLPPPKYMFPGPEEDPFVGIPLAYIKSGLPKDLPDLSRFILHFQVLEFD